MHTDMKLFTFIASSHKSETHLIKMSKKLQFLYENQNT